MRHTLITRHFEAARASATPAALEAVLKAAQGELPKEDYNLLLAQLIVASRSPLAKGMPSTQWQYPLLIEQLRPTNTEEERQE